ncbi:MAG: hypothetical protein L6R37_002196 [Teloschistes peruensis]|nr:MAG: hypothetical protein L6R37_002196 [Teloschistes peruensis]
MARYYDKAQLTDLTIICGDQEIQCHKLVVCAQSSFFRAKCLGGFLVGVVRLEDAHPGLIRMMLEFLYTQKYIVTEDDIMTYNDLCNISRIQILLFRLGEQYQIPTLCNYMSKCLRRRLNSDGLVMDEHFDCVALVYGGIPERNQTLRSILIDALMAYHGRILQDKATEKTFLSLLEAHREFRDDAVRALIFVDSDARPDWD